MENKIKIIVVTALAVILAMVITAATIVLPHTDRDIHGHYRVIDVHNAHR